MDKVKDVLHTIKCFFIAVGRTVKKGAEKVFSPNIKTGLRHVGRMFGAVMGVVARILVVTVLVVILTGTMVGVFGAIYVTRYLDVDTDVDLAMFSLNLTSHVYALDPDRPGEYLEVETFSAGEDRIWAPYEEINPFLVDATVAIEDKRFWDHAGVDWKRTAGAFLNLFLPGGSNYGGSTITQQLIKNTTGDDDATVARKFQEIFRALAFEKKYPGKEGKELILEYYLNTIYLGHGCSGVKAAAERYFNKSLGELTLAECALIVGITNNPSYYDPINRPKNAKRRQEVILTEMYEQQIITLHEYNLAKYQPLVYARRSSASGSNLRSWYIDQVLVDIQADLMEAKGFSKDLATQYIFSGGLHIYTCMDVKIQRVMDEIWADSSCWPATPDAEPPESAMMVVEQSTGHIKAMIGGREKTGDLVRNNATMMKRQPGSSIKPVTVYSPAFELGLITPYTPIDDMPSQDNGGRAWPRNTPAVYAGRMSVLSGVTQSKNAVAVQVLELIGYPKSFDFAVNRLGLSTLVESKASGSKILTDIGAAQLGLGGVTDGVTVRDMTGAYTAIANYDGVRHKTRTYTHILDSDGAIFHENKPDSIQALKEKSAFYMRTCLYNAVNGTGGTGGRSRFDGMPVAGKTGTTTDNKDRWFAGFTPYYTAVCWFGYTIGRDMSYYTNTIGNPAVYMWKQVMERAHEGLERKEFYQPDGLVTYTYCMDSGLPPGDACRFDPRGDRVATGLLDKDDVPRNRCNVHKAVDVCTLTNRLATEYCPLRKRSALLDIVRLSPLPGQTLPDEQYTLRQWGAGEPEAPEGYFRYISAGADGMLAYNTFCTDHIHPPPEEPGDPGTDGPEGGEGTDPSPDPAEPPDPPPPGLSDGPIG